MCDKRQILFGKTQQGRPSALFGLMGRCIYLKMEKMEKISDSGRLEELRKVHAWLALLPSREAKKKEENPKLAASAASSCPDMDIHDKSFESKQARMYAWVAIKLKLLKPTIQNSVSDKELWTLLTLKSQITTSMQPGAQIYPIH